MKKYGAKLKILLDHSIKTQMIYDEKYMTIKFNADNYLPLKKLEFHNKLIVVRSVFNNDKIYYPQIFLDTCLCKLAGQDINIEV